MSEPRNSSGSNPHENQDFSGRRLVPEGKWGRVAALIVGAIVVFFLSIGLREPPFAPSLSSPSHLVAIFKNDEAPPMFFASLNEETKMLTVRALAVHALKGKSYELWFISDEDGIPRSLGILPLVGSKQFFVENAQIAKLRTSKLSISLEPEGGAPTHFLTGPVVTTTAFMPPSN